jgi:hypothetical protein
MPVPSKSNNNVQSMGLVNDMSGLNFGGAPGGSVLPLYDRTAIRNPPLMVVNSMYLQPSNTTMLL